jgi:alkylation response protein AidB-like acyl-CoA dehydrogenase
MPEISRHSGLLGTRAHRLVRALEIYDIFEGTAEIQQLVIARAISGMQIR